ncbi:electron transport complex subunit A [Bacteroidia bacterium]|nr:electron transport complex subunit A [Bacteroidia bacterium]
MSLRTKFIINYQLSIINYQLSIVNCQLSIVNYHFMEYIIIFISAVFVNNIVLAQFLGICPFLGVSKKVETAIGMSAAVAFVMTIATLATYLMQKLVLDRFGLGFMQTISFILIIAALVQMVEIILKKVSPALYQALGVFLPLITTNCTILGVAIMVIQKDYSLLSSVVFAISSAVGFGLALIIFSGIREQLALTRVPKAMQGIPVALVTAGILAMAFMGFSGIV